MGKPEDMTNAEYASFDWCLSVDKENPSSMMRFSRCEDQLEIHGLLFVSRHAPFDLFEQEQQQVVRAPCFRHECL